MGQPLRAYHDTTRPRRRRTGPQLRQLHLGELSAPRPQESPAHVATEAPPARPTLTALPVLALRPELDPLALAEATVGALPGLKTMHIQGSGIPDALLAEGDTVLLQHGAPVVDGELFIIRLSGNTRPLLRRLHREGNFLRLQPENRAFPARVVPRSQIEVDGRVVAVMRRRGGPGGGP